MFLWQHFTRLHINWTMQKMHRQFALLEIKLSDIAVVFTGYPLVTGRVSVNDSVSPPLSESAPAAVEAHACIAKKISWFEAKQEICSFLQGRDTKLDLFRNTQEYIFDYGFANIVKQNGRPYSSWPDIRGYLTSSGLGFWVPVFSCLFHSTQ